MNLDSIINYNLYIRPKHIERFILTFIIYGIYFLAGLTIITIPFLYIFICFLFNIVNIFQFTVVFFSVFIVSPIIGKLLLKCIENGNSYLSIKIKDFNDKINSINEFLYGKKNFGKINKYFLIGLLLILNILIFLLFLQAFNILLGIIVLILGIGISVVYSFQLYKNRLI